MIPSKPSNVRQLLLRLISGAIILGHLPLVRAQERVTSAPTQTTRVVFRLAAEELIPVQTTSLEQPPTLVITFPPHRVTAFLPADAPIDQGVIQLISTVYETDHPASDHRFLHAVEIVLAAPYPYRVHPEPGRIVIDIDHPPVPMPEPVTAGWMSGRVIEAAADGRPIAERFRAMEAALANAGSSSLQIDMHAEMPPQQTPSSSEEAAHQQGMVGRPTSLVRSQPRRGPLPLKGMSWWLWLVILLGSVMVSYGVWQGVMRRARWWRSRRQSAAAPDARTASALLLVDQLIWEAVARQGYQCVTSIPSTASAAAYRIISKDGKLSGLWCFLSQPSLDRRTLEGCVATMRAARLEQGMVITSGRCTVPAQHVASEAGITMIDRHQCIELLGVGALTARVRRQLEQAVANVAQSQAAVRRVTEEMETLRQQRNEASWQLKEERVKLGQCEAEVSRLTEHGQAERALCAQREQELIALQAERAREVEVALRRWEESQWYLGESRLRVAYLEQQLASLQALIGDHDRLQAERDALAAALKEAKAHSQELETELLTVKQRLDQPVDGLQGKTLAGRRHLPRVLVAYAKVELTVKDRKSRCLGVTRDISREGVGLVTTRRIPQTAALRLRLHLPGAEEPLESKVQLVWQQADGIPRRYESGYRFLDVPDAMTAHLEALLDTGREKE